MKKINVTKTKLLDLCISCEICSAICPKNAIAMEYKFGQFLPEVDDERCIECGLCLEICPGINIDPLGLRHKKYSDDIFDGFCLESSTAYSNDSKIRENSTSGGLITTLIVGLIKNKKFEAAFVLPFDIFTGKPPRLKATNEISEILNSSKSKYIPASVYNVIMALKKGENSRLVIVGTPCQIYGIKKYLKKSKISEEDKLFLGLFCDKTLNFNVIRYFKDVYGKSNEKLIKFEFRTKEKYGWPGNTKLYFDSGRELIVDKSVRMQLKKFFQLNRCLFCLDKLNRLADISFGDCYVKGKSNLSGKSSVIVRTKKGKEIFDGYSYLSELEKEGIQAIRKSQYLTNKKDNLEYARVFTKENNIYPNAIPNNKNNSHILRGLFKLQKYIKWGQRYNLNKIRLNIFLSKIAKKLRMIQEIVISGITVGFRVVQDFFMLKWSKRKLISRRLTAKNIIIVGGELFNKGAQAMTFTTVDQIRRRFPNKDIYLFSFGDFDREDEVKNIYKFNILPWNLKIKIRFLGFLGNLLRRSNPKYIENHIREVIKNADFFIDISGYSLSSQWGFLPSVRYLLNMMVAKKFSIPYYIFPQSMGPLNYPIHHKFILYPLISLSLKYPKRIFIRGKEGLKCVRKFTKRNVERSYDIVLQNKGYDLSNIYNKNVLIRDIKIEPNAVGVIPNLRVVEWVNKGKIYLIYKSLIEKLIDRNRIVYILRHSYEDLQVCEEIKRNFLNSLIVKLIPDDFNAIELENIIKQFSFVIASRYHAIVHSYRNGVPALVIGWASKYFELLEDFNQLDYFIDARNNIDVNKLTLKLDKLVKQNVDEKKKIIDKMDSVSRKNVFAIFDKNK